jgi:hypothetical protein
VATFTQRLLPSNPPPPPLFPLVSPCSGRGRPPKKKPKPVEAEPPQEYSTAAYEQQLETKWTPWEDALLKRA